MSEKMQDKMFWQGEGFYKNTQRQNTNGEWRTEWEYTTYPVGTWFDEPDPECEIVWMNEGVEVIDKINIYSQDAIVYGDYKEDINPYYALVIDVDAQGDYPSSHKTIPLPVWLEENGVDSDILTIDKYFPVNVVEDELKKKVPQFNDWHRF